MFWLLFVTFATPDLFFVYMDVLFYGMYFSDDYLCVYVWSDDWIDERNDYLRLCVCSLIYYICGDNIFE
jgi:hypothetical protein